MPDTLDTQALLLLQTWLSRALPTGAFSFSHGLEAAIADGQVHDRHSCENWIRDVLEHGSGWNDAVLFAASWKAVIQQQTAQLADLNALSIALCAGTERYLETTAQGDAFRRSAAAWPSATLDEVDTPGAEVALPVLAGALLAKSSRSNSLSLGIALAASTQSMMSNLVWIAARLLPLGQSDSLSIIASLGPGIQQLAERASEATLDDTGGCAMMADMASLHHEHLAS